MTAPSKRSVTFAGSSWRTRFRNEKDGKNNEKTFFSRLDTNNLGASITAICEEDIEKWMTQVGLLDLSDDESGSLATWEYSTSDADDLTTLKSVTTTGNHSVASLKSASTSGTRSTRNSDRQRSLPSSQSIASSTLTQSKTQNVPLPTDGMYSFEELEAMILEFWQSLISETQKCVTAIEDKVATIAKPDGSKCSTRPRKVRFADDSNRPRKVRFADDVDKKGSTKPAFSAWRQLRPKKFKKHKPKSNVRPEDKTNIEVDENRKRWKIVLFRRNKNNRIKRNLSETNKQVQEESKDRQFDAKKSSEIGSKSTEDGNTQDETSYFLSFVPEETLEMFNNIFLSFSNDELSVIDESKEECRDNATEDEERGVSEVASSAKATRSGNLEDQTPSGKSSHYLTSVYLGRADPPNIRTAEEPVEQEIINASPLMHNPSKDVPRDIMEPMQENPSQFMPTRTAGTMQIQPSFASLKKESSPGKPKEQGGGNLTPRSTRTAKRLLPHVQAVAPDNSTVTKANDESPAQPGSDFSIPNRRTARNDSKSMEVETKGRVMSKGRLASDNKFESDDVTTASPVVHSKEIFGSQSSDWTKNSQGIPTGSRNSVSRMFALGNCMEDKANEDFDGHRVRITVENTQDSKPCENTSSKDDLAASEPIETVHPKLNESSGNLQNDQDNILMEEIHPWIPNISHKQTNSNPKAQNENQPTRLKGLHNDDERYEAISKKNKKGKMKKKNNSSVIRSQRPTPSSFPIKTIEFPADFNVALDDRFGDDIEDPCIVYVKVPHQYIDEVEEHGEVEIPLVEYLNAKSREVDEESSVHAVVTYMPDKFDFSTLVLEATTDNDRIIKETKQWEQGSEAMTLKRMLQKMSYKARVSKKGSRHNPCTAHESKLKNRPKTWKAGLTKSLSMNRHRTADTTNAIAARDDSDHEISSEQSHYREQEFGIAKN
ncbi:hypothetical protein IV203_007502 [Nitzschia inconspicua]|uniref:Uncharacterized protein n=1 Tax=Nitzschia inconspicua TaxID=303405 RepID=A0A9K3KET0_9STRA|nr:hypothetical protein IV203_007502 [Nitzschia inconspicua]